MLHSILCLFVLMLVVEATLPNQVVEICNLPSETGRCRAAFQRYFFNPNTGHCEQFLYGGCEGNENNFGTMEECEKVCAIKEICNLPSETGRCRAAFQRYFFNPSTGHCEQFLYGGCEGNENNFGTIDECEKVCGEKDSIIRPPIDHCPDVVCNQQCENGYIYDIEGCKTCDCKSPDVFVPRPWMCPMYKCVAHCVNGYKKDSRGCSTCQCIKPLIPIEQSRCPLNLKSNIECPMTSTDSCTTDDDCPLWKKCCTYGCTKKCITPLRSFRWLF